MKYQIEEELGSGCLVLKSESGDKVIADQALFAIPPRDNLRLEMQKEISTLVELTEPIRTVGLIKYKALEKVQNDLFFVRETPDGFLYQFQSNDPASICRGLLQVAQILKGYHEQGLVVGGVSQGQLKQDTASRFWLQDPLVINYLRKSFDEKYQIDTPPEVLAGGKWGEQADLFSLGVLAYRLLTGTDPFAASSLEERITKIVRLELIPPKDIKPELSFVLSSLVMDCLKKKPQERISLESLIDHLSKVVVHGSFTVCDAEADAYALKAARNRRRYESKERILAGVQKYGIPTLSGLLVMLLIFFLTIPRTKPVITTKTKPDAIIGYYFQGIQTLNISLMEEAASKVDNSMADLITNLYVIDRAQQATVHNLTENVKVEFPVLQIEPLTKTTKQAKYRIKYTVKLILPNQIEYFDRLDEFTLKLVRHVWRIREIKILESREKEVINSPSGQGAINSPIPK